MRISAGVFEVSLVRVIEETKSVEVVWDRGGKREFKWGSVVFGNTEGQIVGQKPTEPAPEPERKCSFRSEPGGVIESEHLCRPRASRDSSPGRHLSILEYVDGGFKQ